MKIVVQHRTVQVESIGGEWPEKLDDGVEVPLRSVVRITIVAC